MLTNPNGNQRLPNRIGYSNLMHCSAHNTYNSKLLIISKPIAVAIAKTYQPILLQYTCSKFTTSAVQKLYNKVLLPHSAATKTHALALLTQT